MPSVSIHLLSLALCLSSGFQQGYIASVLNQPYKHIEQYMNSSWVHITGEEIPKTTLDLMWALLNVCFPIATIFGQFAAAFLVSRIGRKKTAILACVLYLPGTVLSASSKWMTDAFYLLYVGRIVWSLANGIASVNATVWIVECAPPQVRGRMAAMQEVFMALGSLLTQAVGVPFSSSALWDLMFIPNALVVLANLAMFCFVFESPQYLIEKHGDYDAARQALSAYHGVPTDHPSIDEEIANCEEGLRKKLLAKKLKDVSLESGDSDGDHSAMTIMFNPWRANDEASIVIRQNAWVGLLVKVAYVFTGARCLRSYSSFILHQLGGWSLPAANIGSLVIGLLRLPVTLVPVFLVDRLGRRPLLLGSIVISFGSLAIMELAINLGPSWKVATMIALTALLLINACGLGSISRFYCAEVVPRSVLLKSVSMLTALEAVTKIGVEFAFYPLANVISSEALLMFTIPTAILTFLLWGLCPETSKKSVNEVLNEVARKKNLTVQF